MKILCILLIWTLNFSILCSGQAGHTAGLWMQPRMDTTNMARSDIAGSMRTAPDEVWRMATGGAVSDARGVTLSVNSEATLILVGTNLELRGWDGATLWRRTQDDVRRIMHIGDFNGDSRQEIMALRSTRMVSLYDLETGEPLWAWDAPPSSAIVRSQFYETASGIRFITFPTYSVKGFCFDFSESLRNPALLWEKDYFGKYTTGYGPNIIVKDMDGDGKSDIVLGSKYCEQGEGKTCFFAVLDIDTGVIRFSGYEMPDPEASIDLGRPYGLFQAVDLDGDGFPEVVLVSCQVEEYIQVSRNLGGTGFEKMWGAFVEKDWPEDERELRPQVTSLSDVRGDGNIELIVGIWDNDEWRTVLIDPLKGFKSRRAALPGLYFWGCHDVTGDGIPEIIVSVEEQREPSRITTLQALDGESLKPVATLDNACVFTSGDSDLPADIGFKALRSNPVSVSRADGVAGILVHRFKAGMKMGVCLWGGGSGDTIGAHPVAGHGLSRIDYSCKTLLLTNRAGIVQRFDNDLQAAGKPLQTYGYSCQPLVWSVDGVRELVLPRAGGELIGGVPDLAGAGNFISHWKIRGSMPALHTDSRGMNRLSVVETDDSGARTVAIYTAPGIMEAPPVRIPLKNRPYIGIIPFGKKYRLLVNLSTGVHTNAFACYGEEGKLLWESPGHGAHPRLPAVGDLTGDGIPEVIADDHGEIRVYDASGTLVCGDYGKGFIPPAYVLPVVGRFVPGGEVRILGISGFGGLSLRTAGAELLWKHGDDEYRYYWGLGAVGDVEGNGELRLGIMTEDCKLECIDIEAGSVLWTVDLGSKAGVGSVIAGDVDGDGRDEFITGLPDGRLVAVEETEDGRGAVLWEMSFNAAVKNPVISDIDGDGKAEIIVSTSDGYVRILK